MDLSLKSALVGSDPPSRFSSTSDAAIRVGDLVRVVVGHDAGATYRIAVYEPRTDVAWFLGHPCTMVVKATLALEVVERADDALREDVSHQVGTMHRTDPRRRAHDRQLLGLPA
jgi:hypothetical protein